MSWQKFSHFWECGKKKISLMNGWIWPRKFLNRILKVLNWLFVTTYDKVWIEKAGLGIEKAGLKTAVFKQTLGEI